MPPCAYRSLTSKHLQAYFITIPKYEGGGGALCSAILPAICGQLLSASLLTIMAIFLPLLPCIRLDWDSAVHECMPCTHSRRLPTCTKKIAAPPRQSMPLLATKGRSKPGETQCHSMSLWQNATTYLAAARSLQPSTSLTSSWSATSCR